MIILNRVFKFCFFLGVLTIFLSTTVWAEVKYPNLVQKKIEIKRGFKPEALKCIQCHAKKTPGIVAAWKNARMAHAGVIKE